MLNFPLVIRDAIHVEIMLDFLVHGYISIAKYKFISIVFQQVTDILYFPKQIIHGYIVRQYHGINPPDHCSPAKLLNKQFECFYTCSKRRNFFQLFLFIIIQSILNVTFNVALFEHM